MNEMTKWLAAALLVVGTHLAIAQWLLRPLSYAGTSLPPAPVFVDLEPADAAPQAEQVAAVPEAEAEAEAEAEPLPDFTPPPLLETPPVIENPDPAAIAPPDFAPPTELASLPIAEIADPAPQVLSSSSRPTQRPEQKRVSDTTRNRQSDVRQRQPNGSTGSASRSNAAPPSSTSRRQTGAPVGPGKSEITQWQATVGARIARHMSRTRLSGRGGARVQIAVTVAPNGATTARLASSSGDARNDAALNRQAARMPRMPAPPAGQSQSFVLPIAVR